MNRQIWIAAAVLVSSAGAFSAPSAAKVHSEVAAMLAVLKKGVEGK